MPAVAHRARAQAYPARLIRFVVGYPAGGSTDLVARILGQRLSERLGQPVVIENKPGAGTNLAAQTVVAAPPDGYTLLFAASTYAINVTLYERLPYNFQRDIVPVAGLAELPLVLDVNTSVPANTVAEFIAYAKANPGKINFASFGVGTIAHLAIELFRLTTGVDIVHVPYRGGAPMITDILAGRIQAGIDAMLNSLPHIRAGTVRALAVLPATRARGAAERADRGRDAPGIRGEHLVRRRCAARHAGRCHRDSQPRDQRRAGRSGHQGTPCGRRRHATGVHSRRVRCGYPRRHGEMGQGYPFASVKPE